MSNTTLPESLKQLMKHKYFPVLWVLILVVSIIKIYYGGYDFGVWLYEKTH
jgi:hypothetical protein